MKKHTYQLAFPTISRLPLSSLNTTDAINGWEQVWDGWTDLRSIWSC